MAIQQEYIKDGIKYQYLEGGIELPEKITTINDSNYYLLDTRHIDWNSSYLSYIPEIDKSFFNQYKYVNFTSDGSPAKDPVTGTYLTRYHGDSDAAKFNEEDYAYLPIWKESGKLKDSSELLDLINYLLSRCIYADDKILEFDQLLNLGQVYIEFQRDEIPDWIIPNETLTALENSEIVIYPFLTKEDAANNGGDRQFELQVHLKPKDRIKDNVEVRGEVNLYGPQGLSGTIISTISTAITSGDATVPFYQLYKLNNNIFGFNKNFDYAEISFRIVSSRTALWNSIEPMVFIIKVKKDENPISKILINGVEWIYVQNNKHNEKVFELINEELSKVSKIGPNEYVLIQRNDLDENQLRETENGVIITWYDCDNVENPNKGSIEYYIKNNMFYGRNVTGLEPLNGKTISLMNSDISGNENIIKIYTKYPKLINDSFLSLDVNDPDDTQPVRGVIKLSGNGVKVNGNAWETRNETEIIGNWNTTEKCFDFVFSTKQLENMSGELSMSILIEGTRYVSSNRTLYNVSLPVMPTNKIQLLWKFNENNWNEIVEETGNSGYRITTAINNEGILNNVSISIPLFNKTSFAETDRENTINNKPYLENSLDTGLQPTRFSLWRTKASGEYGKYPCIEVHPEGKNSLINDFQSKICLDYSPLISEYYSNPSFKNAVDSYFDENSSKNLENALKERNGEFIAKLFIAWDEYKGDGRTSLINRIRAVHPTVDKLWEQRNNYPVFNEYSEFADYIELPINLMILSGEGTFNNEKLVWNNTILPFRIKIIRGSNQLTGINQNLKNGKTEPVEVKLLDILKFSDIYGAREQFNNDDPKKKKWVLNGRNKRWNDPNVLEANKLSTLVLRERDIKDSSVTFAIDANKSISFLYKNQSSTEFGTTKDEFLDSFYRSDNVNTINVYPILWQDFEWHASSNSDNLKLIFGINISRLNRIIDGQSTQTTPGIFERYKISDPTLHEELNTHNIKFREDKVDVVANGNIAGLGGSIGWTKTITQFFNSSTTACSLRLNDILTNLPHNTETDNKQIKIIAKLIKRSNENEWNTFYTSLTQVIVNAYNNDSYTKSNIEISNDNIITLKGIRTLLENNQIEEIVWENGTDKELRVKIYVWIPYNKFFSGLLLSINWKLFLDDTYNLNTGDYGELLKEKFLLDDGSITAIIENIKAENSKIIPPYLYHLYDGDGDGIITSSEIEKVK